MVRLKLCNACRALGRKRAIIFLSVRQVIFVTLDKKMDEKISLGRQHSCQHGAFSRVSAIVASFVPTECPVGGGMWGIAEWTRPHRASGHERGRTQDSVGVPRGLPNFSVGLGHGWWRATRVKKTVKKPLTDRSGVSW